EDQELGKADLIDQWRQLLPSLSDGRRSASNEFCGPFKIGDALELLLQAPEECVVFQPVGLLMTKHFVRRTQDFSRTRIEITPQPVEQLVLELDHRTIINSV